MQIDNWLTAAFISRNSKLQIYRPVVTYGSESWTLTMEEERGLAVSERKILRKIYGPVKENELWRIRRNDELEAIINPLNAELNPIYHLLALLVHHFLHVSRIRVKAENFVRFIKGQRIRRLGHTERMQDTAIPKKMLYGKL
jgi:hypothetical protein